MTPKREKTDVKRPTLKMWRYFVLSVDLGSFLKAADALKTDVSIVSREIKILEALMNEPLLTKTKRGVAPTWAGVMRYRQARRLLASYDELLSVSSGMLRKSEIIRMAVPSSMISLFVRWVAEFGALAESSGISVEIEQYSTLIVPDAMGYDYFICKDVLPNIRVVAMQLGFMRNVIVAAPNFLKKQKPVRLPEELEGRQLVAEKTGRVLMEGKGQSIAIWVDPVVRVNDASSLAAPAVAGLGYAVGVPYWLVEDELKTGKLEIVLPDWQIASVPVWLLERPKRKASVKERRLVQYLKDRWSTTAGLSVPDRKVLRVQKAETHE